MKRKTIIIILCLLIFVSGFFVGRLSMTTNHFKWDTSNRFDLCPQEVWSFKYLCDPITRDTKTDIKTIWYSKEYFDKAY